MFGLKRIEEFSLEQHTGNYADWPGKSRLFRNGCPLEVAVPGYCIEMQYQLNQDFFFLVTSYDCPFEEQVDLLLLNRDYKLVAKKSLIPWYYTSWDLCGVRYMGNLTFVFNFNKTRYMQVTLRPKHVFRFFRITTKRLKQAVEVDDLYS